jgi:hypothetical protein
MAVLEYVRHLHGHAKRWRELWIWNYSFPYYRLLGFVTSNEFVDNFLNSLAVKGCISSYPSALSTQSVLNMSNITSLYKKFFRCNQNT